MSLKYIIATIKPWNIDNYHKYFHKKNYFLIDKKTHLTFSKIKSINPRYIFFPHWSWIIPKQIWSNFECVVFHMTDLPFGRGGTPLQNLIIRGNTHTKISALKVNGGVDTGDIYIKYPLGLKGRAETIYKRMSKAIFSQMIPTIITNELKPTKQTGKVIKFQRRQPYQSKIGNSLDLDQVYNQIRMLDAESYPNAYLETNKLKFEFTQARLKHNRITVKVVIYEKK